MTPIVHGKWYPTLEAGYADSPYFKGEVKGCIHKPDRFETGEPCEQCERYIAEFERRNREYWAACDAWRALPFWKRWVTPRPTSPWG